MSPTSVNRIDDRIQSRDVRYPPDYRHNRVVRELYKRNNREHFFQPDIT